MEQFFGNIDISQAMAQRDCLQRSSASMEQLQERLQGMNPHEQRAYLERNHRDVFEKFGDLLSSWNPLNRETDAQAVTRLLNDLRGEQERRCTRAR